MWRIESINNATHQVTLMHKDTKEKVTLVVPNTHVSTPELKNEYIKSHVQKLDTSILRKIKKWFK